MCCLKCGQFRVQTKMQIKTVHLIQTNDTEPTRKKNADSKESELSRCCHDPEKLIKKSIPTIPISCKIR